MPSKERKLTEAEVKEASKLLEGGAMFRFCDQENLERVAHAMKQTSFVRNEVMIRQGETSTNMYVVAKGEAQRTRILDGVEHHIDTKSCGTTINSLHLPMADKVYATALCRTNSCKTYTLSAENLDRLILTEPTFARQVINSLSYEVRANTKQMRTPFLEQHPKGFNFATTTIAAGVESYYRSAMNAAINKRLTGVMSPLFPNMHIQVPTRVGYFVGLKGIRSYLDKNVHPENSDHPGLMRWGMLFAPGILMTPISSVLEASNAGHSNPESMAKRWMRGVEYRCVREIIFAAGLNQLSDYFEERATSIFSSGVAANAAGSLFAGAIAGYFSHVPHNLSALKLLSPHMTYRMLFKDLVDKSYQPWMRPPRIVPVRFTPAWRGLVSCLFPRGCLVRTVQIVGSFVILNGSIYMLQQREMRRAMDWFGSVLHS